MNDETIGLIGKLKVKAALARQLDGSYMDKIISEKAIAALKMEYAVRGEIIGAVNENLRLFRDVTHDFYSANAADATRGKKFLFYVYDRNSKPVLRIWGVIAAESLGHVYWECTNKLIGVCDGDVIVVDVAPIGDNGVGYATMADCKFDVSVPHSANEWKKISAMADSSVAFAKHLEAAFKKAVIARTEVYEAQCKKTMDAIVDNAIG